MKKIVDKSQPSTEATNSQVNDFSETPGLTPENFILLNSGMEIIKQIPDNSPLIRLLHAILFFPAMSSEERKKQIQAISSAKEHLVAKDCFEDASVLVLFFCNLIKYSDTESQKRKDKAKTKTAHEARNSWDKNRVYIKSLWDYLVEVEYKLHPPQQPQRKRSMLNEDVAVRRVFNANKTRIMTVLCKSYDKKRMSEDEIRVEELRAQKKFGAIFKAFTEKILDACGMTVSGHIPEKRAPRSEDSKRKSSMSAKKSIAKRRANIEK